MPTKIYYKHTRVQHADIPYSFKCENCAKDSGPLKAHIVGQEAVYNSNFKTIDDERAKRLEEEAHKNLVKKVNNIHNDVTNKNIYSTDFNDKCPHCEKPQSWGVSGLKKERFNTPIVIFLLGLIVFIIALIGHYYDESMDYLTLPVVFGIFGVFIAAALIVLAYNCIKISKKSKATSVNGAQNIPKIEWNKVQSLLNEAELKAK